jgi:hypothetical protein
MFIDHLGLNLAPDVEQLLVICPDLFGSHLGIPIFDSSVQQLQSSIHLVCLPSVGIRSQFRPPRSVCRWKL